MSDLALSVVLGASVGAGFKGVFGNATKSVGALGAAVKATHSQLNQVKSYQRNESALDATRAKLGETQRKVMGLRQEMAKTGGSAKLTKALEVTKNKAVKLSATLETQRGKLRQEGEALRRAGIDTKDLSSANERLTRTWEKQKSVLGAQYAQMEKRKRLRGELTGQIAKLGTAILAARALGHWTAEAADFDAEMQNIGNTADMTRPQIDALKQSIFDASRQTGRGIGDVQAGIGFLVAAGLDVGRAQKSIVAIGRTATAEAANIEDLSRASFTLIDSMGIKPEGLSSALDILTQAGKEGNVELRDMAQQLPVLGAQFRAFKMQGSEAVATMGAALEIARKGAADPAEAATNMKNYMANVLSPTVLQKAQKNFGLDLYKVIQDAQKSGGNPFEASIQAIMKATHGDAKALGEMFGNIRVQAFLRPMMQQWGEYERIKDKALDSKGVVDRDFAKQAGTTKQQLAQMGQAWQRFKTNVGSALGRAFVNVFGAITPVLNTIAKLAGTFPRLTAAVIAATGAFLTFNTAVLGLKLLASYAPTLRTFGGLVRGLVPGFGLAQKGLLAFTGAWRAFNLSFMLSPVGAIITGIVAAVAIGALVVRKYWEPISAFFTGVWQGIQEAAGPTLAAIGAALAPLKPLWDGIAGAIGAVVGWFKSLLQPVHATQDQLDSATSKGKIFGQALVTVFKLITWPLRTNIKLIMGLGRVIGEVAGWTVSHMGKAAGAVSGAWNGAIAFVGSLWDGLKAKVAAVVDWMMAKVEWVANKWKTIKGLPGAVWGDIKHAGAAIGSTLSGGTAMATAGGPAFNMPAPARRGGGNVTYSTNAPITIHATPGMEERALAKHVRRELDERDRQQAARRRSSLSDLD